MSNRRLLTKRILQTIFQMPPRTRSVFILNHYQGLSMERIAASLAIREDEAEILLSRGNILLHHKLAGTSLQVTQAT